MPDPRQDETRADWLERCIPIVLEEGTAKDNDQAVAICMQMWRDRDKDKKMTNNKVFIKARTDDTLTVAGYGVVFGGIDLEGETFDTDTDFMLNLVPDKLVLYDHGLHKSLDGAVIGKAHAIPDNNGLFVEAELRRHQQYMDDIEALIEEGVLGWSSGSVGHLVRKDGKHIKRWPIVEFSLTPTPAEPRTLGVERIKALAAEYPNLKTLLPAEEKVGGSTVTIADGATATITITPPQEKPMSDEKKPQEEAIERETAPEIEGYEKEVLEIKSQVDALGKAQDASIRSLTEKLNQIMEFMENSPAVKNSGYFTVDGGKADETINSLGDFLKAVHRNDKVRLAKVYKVAMAEGSGAAGGYLVPAQFIPQLQTAAMENAIVRPRATVIPVTSNRGSVPALDHATAPTAGVGQSAWAGGARAYQTAEAAALTESEPAFKEIEFNIHKVGGFSYISNELMADSPLAVEAVLTLVIGRAIRAFEDYAFIRGTGAGMPVGALNAGCAIAVTPDTNAAFAGPDALEMVSRFQPWGGQPVWVMHRSLIPDLADSSFDGAGGDMSVLPKTANVFGRPLYGYPILFSEHMASADGDNPLLADWTAYGIFDREDISIAFSEDFRFTNDQGTWRWRKRLDGKPLLTGAITLGGPTALTVSPFVWYND